MMEGAARKMSGALRDSEVLEYAVQHSVNTQLCGRYKPLQNLSMKGLVLTFRNTHDECC